MSFWYAHQHGRLYYSMFISPKRALALSHANAPYDAHSPGAVLRQCEGNTLKHLAQLSERLQGRRRGTRTGPGPGRQQWRWAATSWSARTARGEGLCARLARAWALDPLRPCWQVSRPKIHTLCRWLQGGGPAINGTVPISTCNHASMIFYAESKSAESCYGPR